MRKLFLLFLLVFVASGFSDSVQNVQPVDAEQRNKLASAFSDPKNFNGGAGASATTFWRGDGKWAVPDGGTPAGIAFLNSNQTFTAANLFTGATSNTAPVVVSGTTLSWTMSNIPLLGTVNTNTQVYPGPFPLVFTPTPSPLGIQVNGVTTNGVAEITFFGWTNFPSVYAWAFQPAASISFPIFLKNGFIDIDEGNGLGQNRIDWPEITVHGMPNKTTDYLQFYDSTGLKVFSMSSSGTMSSQNVVINQQNGAVYDKDSHNYLDYKGPGANANNFIQQRHVDDVALQLKQIAATTTNVFEILDSNGALIAYIDSAKVGHGFAAASSGTPISLGIPITTIAGNSNWVTFAHQTVPAGKNLTISFVSSKLDSGGDPGSNQIIRVFDATNGNTLLATNGNWVGTLTLTNLVRYYARFENNSPSNINVSASIHGTLQ